MYVLIALRVSRMGDAWHCTILAGLADLEDLDQMARDPCYMSAGGSYVEVKREADSNDFFAEDQQSTTGMSGVPPCCISMVALWSRADH